MTAATPKLRPIVLGVLCLALVWPGTALTQSRDVQQRLERMERIIDGEAFQNMVQLIQTLDQENRALRGELETLRNELDLVRNRQRELYMDLDRRLESLTQGGVAQPAPAAQAAEPEFGEVVVDALVDERAAYQRAFDTLRDGRHSAAIEGFRGFLETYPDSHLAANAQYWLGEAYYVTRDFAQALETFERVPRAYPNSDKVPDALLKIGFSHYELGQWEQSRTALNQVVQRFPDGTVARLANQRLARMRDEGR